MMRGSIGYAAPVGVDPKGIPNQPGYTSGGPASGTGITAPNGVAPTPRPARSFGYPFAVNVR